ncbi:uncharacterized protein LOC131953182 [Physella acuta]|uniref:uncharacterized protein LOC131953182 n=1 Tax=Physella acuta TaxID=109671 RepID=UPI0027DC96AD|nr:uncharacterized protein LOC131953182 [Physella acuta]
MAVKRYTGAPFGVQTARFDVNGIHPKSKVPGSYTEIPYDKDYINELDSVKVEDILIMKPICCKEKADCEAAHFAHEFKTSSQVASSYKMDTNFAFVKRNINEQDKLFSSLKIVEINNLSEFNGLCCKSRECDQILFQNINNNSDDKVDENEIKADADQSSQSAAISVNPQDSTLKMFINNLLDQSITTVKKAEEESKKLDIDLKVERFSIVSRDKALSTRCSLDDAMLSAAENRKSSQEYQITIPRNYSTVNTSIDTEELIDFKDELAKTKVEEKKLFFSAEEELNSLLPEGIGINDIEIIKKSSIYEQSESQMKLIPQVLRTIESVVIDDPRNLGKKVDYSSQENLVAVPPNSICTNDEAQIAATAQSKKMKKKNLQRQETCNDYLKRKLGPGVYNLMTGKAALNSSQDKTPKTGWARQLELEKLAALPHLLYKEQWEENKQLKKKLGPGSYNIKDFIQLGNEKPRSERGMCNNLAPRFESKLSSSTPGPGTYGIDGIPQRALEIKDKKSISTKGLLDTGDRKRNLPTVGSDLGPGTYNYKTSTELILNKVVSTKGPYDLFTAERNEPIISGYLAAPKLANLGPGQYEYNSLVDELNSKHKQKLGRFGKAAQYPDIPSAIKDLPGPGTYDPQLPKKCNCAVTNPGFLSSARRDDKISQRFFTGNYNPVGAGRYDVQKFNEAQDVNGHISVFKSKTGRPTLQMYKFLKERFRAKDISQEEKNRGSDPYRMTRSITTM